MNTITMIRVAHERVRRSVSPFVNVAMLVLGFVAYTVLAEAARCLRRDWASFAAALVVGVMGAVILVTAGS